LRTKKQQPASAVIVVARKFSQPAATVGGVF